MISFSDFNNSVEDSLSQNCIRRSEDYRVFIGGVEIPVYTCRISKYPLNSLWPGHQRPIEQSEEVSYVNIVSDEAITLEVLPLTKKVRERIIVKPYSKGVTVSQNGDRIVFTLNTNCGYVLELDDYHGLLYVFNNKPIAPPDPRDVTYYFGPGVHIAGRITLKSNESVYVDRDALVLGSVFADGAENIRIFGNGIFDDTLEERKGPSCYDDSTNGNLKLFNCRDVRIKGVGFTNSAVWCINLFHCFDVEIDSINVFGQWRYNTDGMDIVNSQRIRVRNSFFHSFDDSITVKGIDKYAECDCRDILVENCILWCDWGMTLEIGLETNASEYSDIIFRNCDVLRAGACALDIANGDCAYIHDITFQDISVELESFYTQSLYQKTEDVVYDRFSTIEIPLIFKASNNRFRSKDGFYGDIGGDALYRRREGDAGFASIENVTVKDISIICDSAILDKKPIEEVLKITLRNVTPTAKIEGIGISNITLNGRRVEKEEITLTVIGDGKALFDP